MGSHLSGKPNLKLKPFFSLWNLPEVDYLRVPKHQIGEKQNNAAKYKSTAKKVKPVNEPMPQHLNSPLCRPSLSRNLYHTPLTPFPPEFTPNWKINKERLKVVKFGPPQMAIRRRNETYEACNQTQTRKFGLSCR